MPDPAPKATLDALEDAREAYLYAQKRALDVRSEWEHAGRPTVAVLANGVETAAPLWKVMIDAEKQAASLREKIKPKLPPGRPPGATSAPDRQQRPAPLRAVK